MFEMDTVGDFLRGRQNLTGEFHFAYAQRTAFTFTAKASQIEANQLPHGIEAQAARHYRIANKVATEEPQVGLISSSAST